MKANELMIGDWVNLTYREYISGKVVSKDFRVGQIRKYTSEDTGYHLYAERQNMGDVEEISPIPLTPEILVKNGFLIKHPESEKRTYLKDRAGQIVVHKNRGLLFFNISGNPWKFGWFHPAFSGHIRFVHELQHALKLCGIDKTIEL